MAIVVFDHIRKSYGDNVALREVSLQIEKGEIFGLLGPNGAGKTTLIRILMDIIRPDSGHITLFGKPLSNTQLARISYLPEERGLYRKHKVIEVMSYFGRLKGLDRKEARKRSLEWLAKVGLPEVGDWRMDRLSKGMSQKVQIASALLVDPELCVLDEPFAGLDPVNLRLVQELICDRKSRGNTTILSTHQMNLVETLCDRVGLIHQGELMVYGHVNEVRQRFSLPEIRIDIEGQLPALDGVQEAFRENGTVWRLLLSPEFQAIAILEQLVQIGTPISRFEKVLAPLEDIFVRVVQEGER